MIQLGMRLVRLIALALRLPRDYFDEKFQKPMAFLRPLHYTAEVSNVEGGQFAAGEPPSERGDWKCLMTILPEFAMDC